MNILALYVGVIRAAAILAGVLGLFAGGVKFGTVPARAKWAAAKKGRISADNVALISRIRNNEWIAEQQELDRQN